jgi:hypothetical protein
MYQNPDHPDLEDPRFKNRHVAFYGGDPEGRLLDPDLMGKKGNWDNVTLRFVMDWKHFGIHVYTAEKKAIHMSMMKKWVTRSEAGVIEELR